MVLKPINRKETALYLGYGKNEPDEIILKMMDDCEGPLMEAARPAYAFGVFDTAVSKGGVNHPMRAMTVLASQSARLS